MSDVDITMELGHCPGPISRRDFRSIYPRSEVTLDCLGLDVWRYHILLFCDLMALLRVNWLNRALRRILNSVSFVVEYQSACFHLAPRYCLCERNIFYLNLSSFLDFSNDWRGDDKSVVLAPVHDVGDLDRVLRHFGRTPSMLVQSFQRSGHPPTRDPLKVAYLNPVNSPLFTDGFTKMWVDSCIVPVPRVMEHPVEHRRVQRPQALGLGRWDTESVADYNHRLFWRDCHEVTDDMMYAYESTAYSLPKAATTPTPLPHGYKVPEEGDRLANWLAYCAERGWDPYDPVVDNEDCDGFRCIRWARDCMFETAVGGTGAYPLDLCLHRDDLTRTAYRMGMDYIDRLFVPLNRYRGTEVEWNTLEHSGVLYITGVRYENAPDDFVPWVLSTQALMNSVYGHMWLDGLAQWTRMIVEHVRCMARQIEEDMGYGALCARWRFLQSLCFLGPSVHPKQVTYTSEQRERDQSAIHLLYSRHHFEANRFMSSVVEHDNHEGRYMTTLVEQYSQPTPLHRTESQRVHDARRLVGLMEYVTDFAEFVAPRVDPRTRKVRRRAFELYLSALVPLILFSPGWKRMYHWKPSLTNIQIGWCIPRIDPRHNHRFQTLLNYCNRRTLYYHPNPSLLLNKPDTECTKGWRS